PPELGLTGCAGELVYLHVPPCHASRARAFLYCAAPPVLPDLPALVGQDLPRSAPPQLPPLLLRPARLAGRLVGADPCPDLAAVRADRGFLVAGPGGNGAGLADVPPRRLGRQPGRPLAQAAADLRLPGPLPRPGTAPGVPGGPGPGHPLAPAGHRR